MTGSRSFKTMGLLAVCLMVFAIVSYGTAMAEGKSFPQVPAGKSVYDAPDPLPPGRHGDLIWAAPIKTEIPGAQAWKVLYHSTDVHNVAIPVSGLVVAPVGKAPENGRPIVSYGHGTTGLARKCGISNIENPAKDASFYFFPNSPDSMDAGIPGLTQMIASGYVVAATDYNGLGAPGFHQYLVGPTEGRNVLDAALAAQQIPEAGSGKQVVAIGWSQGGQAAVWAAQLADYVAESANLIGAVAIAPVNSVEQIKIEREMVAAGKKLPSMTTAETMMAFYAGTMTYPDLQLSDVLTPMGIEFVRESAKCQCSKHMGASLVYMEAWKGTATRTDPQNQAAWLKHFEESALGNVPTKVPIAVYQGDDDPAVFPPATEAYVKKACASGATISYTHYADTDHIRASGRSQVDFMNWIADRFAGKPAPSSCK